MRVNAIESTPSPTSFIFKTDEILDDRLTDLQGTTYRAAAQTAPSAVNLILAIDGVTEVYAMRSFVTVSKKPAAPWDAVLPLIVAALASYALPPSTAAATGASWLRGAAVKAALMGAVVAITVGLGDRFGLLVSVGGASLVSSGARRSWAAHKPAALTAFHAAPSRAVSLVLPLSVNLALHRHLMRAPELGWNFLLLAASIAFAADGTMRGLRAQGML